MLYTPLGAPENLFQQLGDCALAAAHELEGRPAPRDEAEFRRCLSEGTSRLGPALQALEQEALAILRAAQGLRLALDEAEKIASFRDATDEVRRWMGPCRRPISLPALQGLAWGLGRYLTAATFRLNSFRGK